MDCFDNYKNATVWYHPGADRIFIFFDATFLMLPCLEREDGVRMILNHPNDVNALDLYGIKMQLIGEL